MFNYNLCVVVKHQYRHLLHLPCFYLLFSLTLIAVFSSSYSICSLIIWLTDPCCINNARRWIRRYINLMRTIFVSPLVELNCIYSTSWSYICSMTHFHFCSEFGDFESMNCSLLVRLRHWQHNELLPCKSGANYMQTSKHKLNETSSANLPCPFHVCSVDCKTTPAVTARLRFNSHWEQNAP